MAFLVSAMAARIPAAGETAGEGSGQQIGWDGETAEQMKFVLTKTSGPRAARFLFHIVAMMLQDKQKMQAFSERENRTQFLYCLSSEGKAHPSGLIHARYSLPSEIADAGFPSAQDALRLRKETSSRLRACEERLVGSLRRAGTSFPVCAWLRSFGDHSERSACITSTRAARAAGSIDATTAAISSTNAETTTGNAPGIFKSQEITTRHTRHHEPECRAGEDARRSHHAPSVITPLEEIARAAIQAPGECRIPASAR